MDAQELWCVAGQRSGGRLGLEGGEQRLEPLERGGIIADPDELDAAETAGRAGSGA